MPSKKELGHHYRVTTLALLARLGYATTRQIAKAVFGVCDHSSRKMAGRTIRWLIERNLVVEKRDGDSVAGERMIALNRAGVDFLAREKPLPGGHAHARDWLRHAHAHRTACNSVYSAFAGDERDIDLGYTELEIRAGEVPMELAVFRYRMEDQVLQKIPDLLLHFHSNHGKPYWVEVENSWRGAKDFTKLIDFLRAMFNQPTPPVCAVWFVVTSQGANSIGKRLLSALAHGPRSGASRRSKELDARILANHILLSVLDQDTLELTDLELQPCEFSTP